MSPASLRRYRAERLLREEFRALRASVTASTRGKLRGCGAELDDGDLEACYAQAWQGLYLVMLAGEEVLDPGAWLTVATFRRALDEHRAARRRPALATEQTSGVCAPRSVPASPAQRDEADPASELDRRLKLGQLFEALRLRLTVRERRAFALCYLQGLSRAEAAAALGLSERRMRKLMDGRGAGDAGMSAKVSELVHAIRDEKWCEQQGSLMRGFAYGVLDPQGERHRLAVMHTHACPACRSYVASLRGLAALLPPMPGIFALFATAGGAARDATRHAAARAHASAGASARGGGALATPAAAASTTAGAGAAGGGWLVLGGGAGAKLAATCLLALGLGAGCAALTVPGGPSRRRPASPLRAGAAATGTRALAAAPARPEVSPAAAASGPAASAGSAGSEPALTPAERASREFGPEQAGVTEAAQAAPASQPGSPRASASRATAAAREFAAAERSSRRGSGAVASATSRAGSETSAGENAPAAAATPGEGGPAQAQREFSPG